MSGPDLFDFSEDDLLALVASGSAIEEDEDDEDMELQRLSRQISGQYVDVLASFASEAFGGNTNEMAHDQVVAALDALRRLATASKDSDLVGVLDQLAEILPGYDAQGSHARRRFMGDLREWVLQFAMLLDEADRQRMEDLVTFNGKTLPLLDELSNIRGIGPKRLQRLYCAGLFTVEVVSRADATEVAQVTGLPLKLAEEVVEATARFADAQRRTAAADLTRRARELRRSLASLDRDDPMYADLVQAALTAMNDLKLVLASTEAPQEDQR